MQQYQKDFIRFAIDHEVLCFGKFTLKSGRVSPYFFNAGLFNTGRALSKLGQFYASTIVDSGLRFDVLFGPAYKGIPLAASCAVSLAEQHNLDIPYCFNRKEAKNHGEGGSIVGSPLSGKVLIIDDVITAGTAIREAMDIINVEGATLAGVIIALDRQERGSGELSAIQEVEQNYNVTVLSIIKLEHLISYLKGQPDQQPSLNAILAYQSEYGINPA